MRVWTYGEAQAKLLYELDLVNETFIQADEYVGFWNDGLQTIAAHISKLGVEDEYLTKQAPLPITKGQVNINPPSDMYLNKIRGIVYQVGDEIYTVWRLRRRGKYVKQTEINQLAQDVFYQYDVQNPNVATGFQLVLVPPSRETSNTALTIHYIREVLYVPLVSAGSQAATNATLLDMPGFMTFLFAYVRARIAKKIPHPNLADFESERDMELKLMIDTLTEQIADDATEVEPDMNHYWRST